VNYYTPELIAAPIAGRVLGQVAHTPNAAPEPSSWPGSNRAWSMPQDGPYTAMGWRIEPAAFAELLERVGRDYPGLPIMITENGAAFTDPVAADGVVHDTDRIDYLDGHLRAMHDAIGAGVDVRGYFVWSVMDNFEWAWGYEKTFGIVHVDYRTLVRTPKDSAHWYRAVIAANGLTGETQ
jgi:beta-glucosidase